MTPFDDSDIERRLRRIADPPPEAPDSLDYIARQVVRRKPRGAGFVGRVVPRGLGRRPALVASAALAAVATLALVGGLVLPMRGPAAAATWTPRADTGSGEWTALEWHDITTRTNGMFTETPWWLSGWGVPGIVRYRGGLTLTGSDMRLWLSKDGLTWTRSSASPQWSWAVALGDELLVQGEATPGESSKLWLSADGEELRPVSVPFDLGLLSGLTSGHGGVVAVTNPRDTSSEGVMPPGPPTIYFTTDARTWTQASLPADLAVARGVSVAPFIDGFVASGQIADPIGSRFISDDKGHTWRSSDRSWISRDGLNWSVYDRGDRVGSGMNWGRLGAGDGDVYSTDGGKTWLPDSQLIPQWPVGSYQLVSDGTRMVMATGGGVHFYLSEGDGTWVQLEQGGDVGNLPSEGVMLIEPAGVLWISGSHVYFGEGLSRIAPIGSMGPPVTPSPGPPTATPAEVLPTNSPGELSTHAVAPSPAESPAAP